MTMARRKGKEREAQMFINIHVNPVLEELVRNCVLERPEDMLAYSVKFFQAVEEELNYEYRNRAVLLDNGASRMVRNEGQTIKMVVLEGIGSERRAERQGEEHFFQGSRYKAGDELKMNSGKVLYTVKRLLGSGSFGEVHVVQSHNEDILCAMKCTKLDNMTKRQRLSLFKPMCEEALIGTKTGDHANLVGLRFVQVNGTEFLVMMNFVKDACELQKAIATKSLWNKVNGGVKEWGFEPPREEITSTIALCWYQVCSALEHLHGLEIAHCDVKPENILVNVHNWHIWVFDLGLARQGRMSDSTHGIVNIRCDGCSPAYASPELGDLMGSFKDGMTAREKNELQSKHLITPATGDLWAGGMSMLETVFQSRNGVWVQGRDGPVTLQRYKSVHFMSAFAQQQQAQQTITLAQAGEQPPAEAQPPASEDKPLYKWTHSDVQGWMELTIRHENQMTSSANRNAHDSQENKSKRHSDLVSILENVTEIDGKYLFNLKERDLKKHIKKLAVRKNFFGCTTPFRALPITSELFDVFEKCLHPDKTKRYLTARLLKESLLPLFTPLKSLIPRFVQPIPQANRMGTLQNISNALMNHGLYLGSRDTYKRIQAQDPEYALAISCIPSTYSLEFIFRDEDQSNERCEQDIERTIKEVSHESSFLGCNPPPSGEALQFLAEGFGALWALCIGNPDHSDIVVYDKDMLESIRNGFIYGDEKVALGCLGLVVDCIAGATKNKIEAVVEAGIHDLIKVVMERYQRNGWILLQALKAIVWFTFQVEERSKKFIDDGTIALLLSSWKMYLLHDPVVVLTFLNFMVFLPSQSFTIMRNNSFAEVIRSVMDSFSDNQAIQHYGSGLLTKVEAAPGREVPQAATRDAEAAQQQQEAEMRERQAAELRKKQVADIRARQAIDNDLRAKRTAEDRTAEDLQDQSKKHAGQWAAGLEGGPKMASVGDVGALLESAGLGRHAAKFANEDMGGESLLALTKDELLDLGITDENDLEIINSMLDQLRESVVDMSKQGPDSLVKFVRIEHSRMWLHVSRVEVYDANGENVALLSKGATADASSVAYKGDNNMPIDGQERTEGWPSGCHTNNGPEEWYEVTLRQPTVVTKVVVVNRVDACFDRLMGARVVLQNANRVAVPTPSLLLLTSTRTPQQFPLEEMWAQHSQEEAAVMIQKIKRRKDSQVKVQEMKEQDKAATLLQAKQRRTQAQAKVGKLKEEKEQEGAAVKIQAIKRRKDAQLQVQEMKQGV
jgi:serine/threonine protein kinase